MNMAKIRSFVRMCVHEYIKDEDCIKLKSSLLSLIEIEESGKGDIYCNIGKIIRSLQVSDTERWPDRSSDYENVWKCVCAAEPKICENWQSYSRKIK